MCSHIFSPSNMCWSRCVTVFVFFFDLRSAEKETQETRHHPLLTREQKKMSWSNVFFAWLFTLQYRCPVTCPTNCFVILSEYSDYRFPLFFCLWLVGSCNAVVVMPMVDIAFRSLCQQLRFATSLVSIMVSLELS